MTDGPLTTTLDASAPGGPDYPGGARDGGGMGWPEFERRLASSLASLPAVAYLIVETRHGGHSTRYVQFAREEEGLLAEAVSNHYLSEDAKLAPEQDLVLDLLGWDLPDAPARHEHNWERQFDLPVPFGDVASLAVRTLREAYAVGQPADLVYRRFQRGGGDLPDPALGLEVRPEETPGGRGPAAWRPAAIDAVVERVVTAIADPEHIGRPAKGIWEVETGGQVLHIVRLPSRPPVVRVWAVFMAGVETTGATLWALNEANQEILTGRVFWHAGNLILAMEVAVGEAWEERLRLACFDVASVAAQLLPRFLRRLPDDGFGGRRPRLH